MEEFERPKQTVPSSPVAAGDRAPLDIIMPPTGIGAEIRGFDLRTAGDEEIAAIRRVLYERKLVVIRDQFPSEPEYIALARRFGAPQIYLQPNYHHPDHPEIFVSSNEELRGQKFGVRGTGRYWHTDYSFMPEPLPVTMLRARTLPHGVRETYYIDMARVLDELPADLRATIERRRGVHEGKYRYKVRDTDVDVSLAELLEAADTLAPPALHPCVIEHPVTGRKILYLNRGFSTGIEGLPHEEAQDTLRRIFDFAERAEHVHTHAWQEGDLLLWDNRYLLHRAGSVESGESCTTFRIGIYDGLPFYVGLRPTDAQPVLRSGPLAAVAAAGGAAISTAHVPPSPPAVAPAAARRVEPLPDPLVARVLRPYQAKGCVYVERAWAEVDERAPSWLQGGLRLRARLGIPESCYIDDTGHFNSVEFSICFNQIAYLYGATLTQRGLMPGTRDMGDFERLQLPSMLIRELDCRYERAIDSRAFDGEVWMEATGEKTHYFRLDLRCRFWDDAGGRAEGSVVIAVLKQDQLQRGTPRQRG